MPTISHTPSLSGFAEAQDRKRLLTGSVITFMWPVAYSYDASVPINPLTGAPFDPTASATASAQATASAIAGAFFKATSRGGAGGGQQVSPVGRGEETRVFLTMASADAVGVQGATHFMFHGNRFAVYATKFDEVIQGYVRYLVYGAAEASDTGDGAP